MGREECAASRARAQSVVTALSAVLFVILAGTMIARDVISHVPVA